MTRTQRHATHIILIVVILLTILFILGEKSFKEVVRYTPPPTTQTAAVADFDSSLIAHYTFDGNTADSAGSNTGTASGGPTYVTGRIGQAIQFDGVDDVVKTTFKLSGLNDLSISLWVYEKKDTHGQRFISFQNGNASRFYFGTVIPSGGPRLHLGLSAVEKIIGQQLALNTWEHYVITVEGTTVTLYHNGANVFSQSNVTPSFPTYSLLLGCDNAYGNCGPNTFLEGMIDDVRIYNKALSGSEISDLYALGGGTSAPSTPPPVTLPPTTQPTITIPSTIRTGTETSPPSPATPPPTSPAPTVSGDIVTALSCSQEHVQAAIDAAKDGNIVQIPSGTCTWNKTVIANLYSPARSMIIQGAGIDQTTIIDEVPTVNTQAPILVIRPVADKAFRLTGLTVKSSPNMTAAAYHGAIAVSGSSKQVRLDHIRVDITHRSQIAFNFAGDIYAVVDHVTVDNANQALRVWHSEWDGKTWGDGSWASPLSLGTEKAVYIEDSVFRNRVVTDAYGGARYVVRYNTIETATIPVQNHGTESSGRIRGAFSWEVYNNTVKLSPSNPMFHMRSGTGVIFNNTMTGSSYVTNIGTFNTYRTVDGFSPWGTCDGTSLYDKNDGVVYDTGTQATGVSATNGMLTAAGKNWSTNQWIGYSLVNTTKKWGSEITGNTATTITIKASVYSSPRLWDPGDTYQILRVEACLDQVGRSTGSLVSSDYTNPLPKVWPNQTLEPVYLWGNVFNGASNNKAFGTNYAVKRGRDFIEGTPRPGYTPYTYPHPFTTSGFTGDDPSKPLPPPATPAPLSGQPPASPTCTSFTYSSWGTCTNGNQIRTVTSSSPSGCTGGTPVLTQSCSLTTLTADFNHDGAVNTLDFSLMISAWNTTSTTYDLNHDNTVNTLDYSIMAGQWTG